MAVSIANKLGLPYRIVGAQKETVRDVTFDSSYTSGGEALTAADLGLNVVERAVCNVQSVGGTVNVASASYDEEEELIHLFDETPGEVASEANVSEVVVRVVARGN